MKTNKSGRNIWIIIALVIFFSLSGKLLYDSAYGLTCTVYTLSSPKITQAIRIVQLTDLHNGEFGANNAGLVELVSAQEPDIILMTGDMLNEHERKTDIAVNLIERLTSAAPVYFSYGNHEKMYEERFGADLNVLFTQAGATVLERAYDDIEINGQPLRIGGLYGYALPEKYLRTGEAKAEECQYLEAFQDTQRYTILMAHLPTCWILNDNLDVWQIDSVFSGHTHGGQIRLPWIGGLYAPDAGFFPGRECGLYFSQEQERVLVLSRGLGCSRLIPRVNNVPEVVVVNIVPQE